MSHSPGDKIYKTDTTVLSIRAGKVRVRVECGVVDNGSAKNFRPSSLDVVLSAETMTAIEAEIAAGAAAALPDHALDHE